MRFTGKVAIVTGAGQGIGLEICQQLAAEGAHVILNDQDDGLSLQAAKSIIEKKGSCIPIPGDASDPAVISQMMEAAVSGFGKLDIAIANAGITLFGDFFQYPVESFQKVMQVNAGGSFFLAQAAARQMRDQGHGGSLLFMSSVTGHQAHKDLAAYGMSKAAIEMLARNLVIELSPFRINVNTVAPGATLTGRTLQDKEYENTWSRLTPMGKAATVPDIASAVLFLVSQEARHITGQTLIIDGGWTRVSPGPF